MTAAASTTLRIVANDEPTPLGVLAEQINHQHSRAINAMRDALGHAVKAGEMLREAKSRCRHGQWLQWLNDQFDGSRRTAQRYMVLAENQGKIKDAANASRVSYLSVNEAMRVIAQQTKTIAAVPTDRQDEVIEATERGDRHAARRAVVHAKVTAERKAQPPPDQYNEASFQKRLAQAPVTEHIEALRDLEKQLSGQWKRCEKLYAAYECADQEMAHTQRSIVDVKNRIWKDWHKPGGDA